MRSFSCKGKLPLIYCRQIWARFFFYCFVFVSLEVKLTTVLTSVTARLANRPIRLNSSSLNLSLFPFRVNSKFSKGAVLNK